MERLEESNNVISIIIPTLNEEKFLPLLLNRILEQEIKKLEILIADANSTDKTKEIALSYGCKVVQGGTISVGRNNGAKNANGDIFIFMDADIEFENHFLKKSLEEFISRNLEVAITKFDSNGQSWIAKLLYFLSDLSKVSTEKSRNKFGTCQCIFIKRSTFESIGGFNENVIIGEDIDFMKKISEYNLNYGVISTKIKASDRRFLDVGLFRVLLGSIFIALLAAFSLYKYKSIQNFVEKIYGGWGKW